MDSDRATVVAWCAECATASHLEAGGLILNLAQPPAGARFDLGRITVTPGAVEALAESREHAVDFVTRHAQGDWGKHGRFDDIQVIPEETERGFLATEDDAKVNKISVLTGQGTVMGSYHTSRGRVIWVMTVFGLSGNQTSVLLPEEY
jgi:hypothetical protein